MCDRSGVTALLHFGIDILSTGRLVVMLVANALRMTEGGKKDR